ncbi:MAG TPA: hypothetical protein VGM90_40175 [Kofleriaceae bacterium]|jgi:hypothetical protein
MIKFLIYLALAIVIVWLAVTVPLGKRTLWGHMRAIWATSEVQDLKNGVEEKAGPTVEKVKRGVKAGIDEADKDGSAAHDAGMDALHAAHP